MSNVGVVKNLLDSYIMLRNKRAIFVKQDKLEGVALKDILESEEDRNYVNMYYHEYKSHEMRTAYEPFLGWIKDTYYEKYADDYSVEEFVKNCGIYSLQQDTIAAYIKDGKARRMLDVMVEEYDYECDRMTQSFCSAMEYIAEQKPIVLAIDKVFMAPFSVLRLINYMIKRVRNIYFIFTYDENYLVKEYCRSQWDVLMNMANENNMMFELSGNEKQNGMRYPDEFVCKEELLDNYIVNLFDMIHTFCSRDAMYYAKIISEFIARDNKNITSLQKFYVYMAIANAELALSNYKNVLYACEKMVPLLNDIKDLKADYVHNYIMAKAQLLLSDSDLTYRFCKQCRNIANKLGNEKLLMNVDVIETVAHYGTMKEMFKCDYTYKVSPDIIERLKKYNHENFLAYVYAFSFENDEEAVISISNGERESVYFSKAIEIGERLNNKNFLLMAYMKNVILYSEYGRYDCVTIMYEKRLKNLDKDKPVRIAHAYSGLAYNCVVLEEYSKADAYLKQGMRILMDEKCAEDLAETLYNMLVNYYVAGCNQKTVECGTLLFKILELIGIHSIQICNTSKLYGFVVLAYYKLGQIYDCYYYLNKMEVTMSYILGSEKEADRKLWYSDLFVYYLCKANMAMYEEQYSEAEEYFALSKTYMMKVEGDRYYSDMEYARFVSLLYDKQNRLEEKQKVFEETYDYYISKNYKHRAECVKAMMEGREYKIANDFANDPLPAKAILEMSELYGAKKMIEDREKDVNFLALCHETMGMEQDNVLGMVENAVNIIQNSFNLDRLVLLEKKNDKYTTTYSNGAIKLNVKDIKDLFDFFESYRMEFISSRIDNSFTMYNEILDKFNAGIIATIVGIPIFKEGELSRVFIGIVDVHRGFTANKKFLNTHNLTIMKYAVNQLSDSIKRIMNNCMINAMNLELSKSAVTDQLTGIYNRMGLDKLVKDGLSEKGSLLYLDLDYFKKYNDTYGHDTGDLILKCFANILADNVKNIGYAIRYGGDEFVAIIPEKDEAFAKKLATNINEEFKENYEVKMAIEGQMISASIGVAEYDDSSKEGIEQGLKAADLALYEVKNLGRGRVIGWSELE